jgi:hypothetical protein
VMPQASSQRDPPTLRGRPVHTSLVIHSVRFPVTSQRRVGRFRLARVCRCHLLVTHLTLSLGLMWMGHSRQSLIHLME